MREPEGVIPFFEAYNLHPAGTAHDLVLVFKGAKPVPTKVLNGYRRVYVSDFGLALCAFGKVLRSESLCYDAFCFLNSWSRPQADGWLAKLTAPLANRRVGLSGATGSLETFSRGVTWRRALFPPFPNPHIRTNAFCGRTEVLLRVWPKFLYGMKQFEYLHEAGRIGMSRKCKRLGLLNVVVDAEGGFHPSESCRHSKTYRSGAQENLLVADNQTDLYRDCEDDFRKQLARRAWGS